ncbi:hypothetical protein FLK61_25010 [Paenalkalicoccus suaedae]|uniref:Uncharacterized protein n=1 Tax=Paenalkalicoccus suaedae TaxID=2592382 RepID=A0A859FCT9_9BACI|nr:hypothetical protein [Paenalkalicoccus suaedae]QKS70036.1 hypothetical protein FLK61_25010 [Paenalkalicoccus suaedae]
MNKKVKLILAIFITLIVTAIPSIGVYAVPEGEGYMVNRGFPAAWIDYHTSFNNYSFNAIGLLINIALFYFLLTTIERTYLLLKQKQVFPTSQSK